MKIKKIRKSKKYEKEEIKITIEREITKKEKMEV